MAGGFDLELDLNFTVFSQAASRWARISGKSHAQVLRTSAKMTLSNPRQGTGLLQITPPGSQGVTGAAARRQGERAIARDLARIFEGVAIKGKGPPPPDPILIHRRHFYLKRPGRRMRRDRGQPYFVDAVQLALMRRILQARVGKLAAGWTTAARAVGAAVPAWIARHGSERGLVDIDFRPPRYSILMVCLAPPGAPVEELRRRVPFALSYATRNLERQIVHWLRRDAARAGFRVAA